MVLTLQWPRANSAMPAPVELSMVLNPPLGSLTEATICRYFQLALSDLYVEQKLSQCGAVPFS